jgi:HAMP domain-containing protein
VKVIKVIAVLYLISVLAVAASVVVLLAVVVRLAGPTRRLADTARQSRAHFADRTGALAARVAALRIAVSRRRHRNGDSSPPAAAA